MAGPRLTLLLCLVVPLTLSLPTALMAAELTALMPVEGAFISGSRKRSDRLRVSAKHTDHSLHRGGHGDLSGPLRQLLVVYRSARRGGANRNRHRAGMARGGLNILGVRPVG